MSHRPIEKARINAAATNIAVATWLEVNSGVTGNICAIEVFNSTGQLCKLGLGPSGSEVEMFLYVFPGGIDPTEVFIPRLTRVSVKAVTTTATVGEFLVHFHG